MSTNTPHFPKSAIRAAILRAADKIQNEPDKYDFWKAYMGDTSDCGCMLFHVGRALGVQGFDAQDDVGPLLLEGRKFHPYSSHPGAHFYHWCSASGFDGYADSPIVAASALRAYAAKYFPAAEGPLTHHDLIPLADFTQGLDGIRAGAVVEAPDGEVVL